jgi:hypothetical protein
VGVEHPADDLHGGDLHGGDLQRWRVEVHGIWVRAVLAPAVDALAEFLEMSDGPGRVVGFDGHQGRWERGGGGSTWASSAYSKLSIV